MTAGPVHTPTAAPPAGRADPAAHARDLAELLAELGTDSEHGLTTHQAAERLARDGENVLRTERPVPLWRRFLSQFNDPLIILLLIAIGISVVAWLLEGGHGTPVDGIVIAAIVLLNAIIGVVQEGRAAAAVAALQELAAPSSTVLRDGAARRIPAAELVVGDLLVLEEGDAVAADARLVQAANLLATEAALTGESAPVEKRTGVGAVDAPLAERHGMVYAGTSIAQGVGRAVVTSTGMRSEMGAIAELLERTQTEPTPLEREIGLVGRVLTIAVIAIALVVMGTVYVITPDHSLSSLLTILLLGVSLAVAAVPEGLPAILSLVLALGVQRMAERRAIVKQLASVETLGSASVICTDKTGTLTRNEMTIERVVTPVGTLRLDARDDAAAHHQSLETVVLGTIANNASVDFDRERPEVVGDPTEAAFLLAAHELRGEQAEQLLERAATAERLREVPFTSARKLMSVVVRDRDAVPLLVAKGAPDVLLGRCTTIRDDDGEHPLDEAQRETILAEVATLSDAAYRTLGVAVRRLDDERLLEADDEQLEAQLVWIGVVGIVDPPRHEIAEAIAECRSASIRVIMITGDHPRTAARIAGDLGILDAIEGRTGPSGRLWPPALTGNDLDRLDEAQFDEAVQTVDVYARVAPKHKLAIVERLRAHGAVVAMAGDGVNDAPALKQADIGVAMGITGTQVTREAANMVLADDNFATIVGAVREGRGIFTNIQKFLRYLLSSNMGEVLTVFLGVALAGILGLYGPDGAVIMPLLATQILWINLLTDSAPALALGVDPTPDDVMHRPPRRREERVIDGRMWSNVVFIGFVMAAATLLALDSALPGGLIEGDSSVETGRTLAFTVLVLAQLFNTVNCRSDRDSAFRGLFHNRWLWGAIALSAVLQLLVVYLPVLNTAFGTTALDAGQWALCILLASSVLWLEELKKLAGRLLGGSRGSGRG